MQDELHEQPRFQSRDVAVRVTLARRAWIRSSTSDLHTLSLNNMNINLYSIFSYETGIIIKNSKNNAYSYIIPHLYLYLFISIEFVKPCLS